MDITSRLYDYLIDPEDKDDGRDFMEKINQDSLEIFEGKAEPIISNRRSFPIFTKRILYYRPRQLGRAFDL